MVFRNREGTAVDPVPYLVVASLSFLFCFSFGPAYCLSLGSSLPVALTCSGVVFVALVVGTYHQMVWVSRPELLGEIPAYQRLQRLFYLIIVVALLLFALSMPFLLDGTSARTDWGEVPRF